MLITTEAVVADIKEEKEDIPMPAQNMGMGGMM
jgi:hypothetical protein